MGKSPRQLKGKDIRKFRKWLLYKQKGICPICKKKIEDPCLDHSHQKRIKGTGLCRGVLCRGCNVFLGKMENNCIRYAIKIKDLPIVLKNTSDYLAKKHLPYIHPSEKPKEPKLMLRSFTKLQKLWNNRYPNRKTIEYPKSKKLTKKLSEIYKEFNIEPEFYK